MPPGATAVEETTGLPPGATALQGDPALPPGASPVKKREPTPLSVFGVPLAGDTPKILRPILGFTQEFMKGLAGLAALPVEAVDLALRQVGVKVLNKEGNAIEAFRDAMQAAGGSAEQPVSDLVAQLGKEGAEAFVMLAAVTAAAPAMVLKIAQQSPSVLRNIVDQIGRVVIQQPAVTAASEAGATIGGVVGEREGGPVGRVAGAVVGGMGTASIPKLVIIAGKKLPVITAMGTGAVVGGGVAGFPGALGGAGLFTMATNRAFRGVRNVARRHFGRPPPRQPILGEPQEGAVLSAVRRIEENEIRAVEAEIDAILRQLPTAPARRSISLRASIDRAIKAAKKIESKAYSKEFLDQTTNPAPLVNAAKKMAADPNLAPSSDAVPTKFIHRALSEFKGKEVTGRQIQNFRSDLVTAARHAGTGSKANRSLARNIMELADAADDALRQIEADPVDIMHALSRRLNALFFDGPLGKVTRGSVDPEDVTGRLLKQPRGFRQIEPIAKEFKSPSLVVMTRGSVRATFRAIAEQAGEKSGAAATKFMKDFESAINSLADEAIVLQKATAKLVVAQAKRLGIQKGALGRFLANDPDADVALKRIFTAPNPAKMAGDIRRKLIEFGDDDALAAFEHDILAELFRRFGYSAANLKGVLDNRGNIRRLVEAALPESSARLFNLVDRAALIETGEETIPGVSRALVIGPLMQLVAKVAGSGFVKKIGKAFGSPATIQATGGGAAFAKAFTQRMTGKIDPEDIFAMAVRDPQFEQLLENAIPLDAQALKSFTAGVKALISAEAASRTKRKSGPRGRRSGAAAEQF